MTQTFSSLARYQHAPLFGLITAFLMLQPLSTDLYLASLPSLANVFSVPSATVQLSLTVFVLGFGCAQLMIGPLSDRFGRRPVVLTGLSLYVIASLVCSLAPSIWVLIGARFVQALGCCSASVTARAVVRDAYEPEDSVRVIAKAGTWLSMAPLLGPIVGSYLQVNLGWQAAFIVHASFATGVALCCYWYLPETNAYKNPHATNLTGIAANYRIILGSKMFWRFALPGALAYGSIFVFISGSSLALIRVLHFPTQYFGYCFAFGVSGYLLGTLVFRRIHAGFGDDKTLRLGTSIVLSAGLMFLLFVLVGWIHWVLIPLVMFLTMGAYGMTYPIFQSNTVSPFPQQAGTAAGLMGALFMFVAFGIGTLVGVTFNGSLIPLASISCAMSVLIFVTPRMLQAISPRTIAA